MEVVANDALARLSDMILEKGAKVVFPSVWHAVQGNKAWLEEVLINYFSNAMKYGGTPPEIKISSQIIGSEKVKFIVSDNGRGLSAEEIERLFIQFARLDTLRAEGHGLGLSIVKRIVEKLGGEVGVDSLNIPGEGSSFYFILPLAR
jgi:signal transduction histidine kinase